MFLNKCFIKNYTPYIFSDELIGLFTGISSNIVTPKLELRNIIKILSVNSLISACNAVLIMFCLYTSHHHCPNTLCIMIYPLI